jgi:hypothetical protein
MKRGLMLGGIGLCVFVVVAAIMSKVMPEPMKESDYLVIGSAATLVALLAMFLVLISTTMKTSNIFFKRRKK